MITLIFLEKRIHLASFTSFVLQVFEYNLTTTNSSSSNSSSLISCGVAIEDHFLKNGASSSVDIYVSKKLFLPFLDNDDVVLQPLNAWKNRNAKDLSDPNHLAIW